MFKYAITAFYSPNKILMIEKWGAAKNRIGIGCTNNSILLVNILGRRVDVLITCDLFRSANNTLIEN